MYTKDKTNRITLRLNEDQFEYCRKSADFLGVSPSEFLRMVVNVTMSTDQMAQNRIRQKMIEEEKRRENEQTTVNS